MPCDNAVRAGVDQDQLVRGGRGREQPVQPGDDEHAMHVRKPTDRVDDAPSREIDDDDAALTLMGDVETSSTRVDRLIVEPGAAPTERHARNEAPRHSRRHANSGDGHQEQAAREHHAIISDVGFDRGHSRRFLSRNKSET